MAFLDDGGDLEAYWRTISQITDLVGTGDNSRIYWDMPRQKVAVPYIVCAEAPGGASHMHLTGLSGVRHSILHVYCYGATPSAARQLADIVRLSVQGKRQLMGSTWLRRCEGGEIDSGEDGVAEASDVKRFWRRLILSMSYDEATSLS